MMGLTEAVEVVMSRTVCLLSLLCVALALAVCTGTTGYQPREAGTEGGLVYPEGGVPPCTTGIDQDNDGYGVGCPAGPDCDDHDPTVHPGAKEICDYKDNDCNGGIDEGLRNACNTCEPGCTRPRTTGQPFPIDATKDPGVKDVNGVGLNSNGDLVLDKTKVDFNYMWIANTFDTAGATGGCAYGNSGLDPSFYPKCRGTVSKIDTKAVKEVARYFTVTCYSKPGVAGCLDVNGKAITKVFVHAPSRTAVDYNFDVWVANRAFGGQPSTAFGGRR